MACEVHKYRRVKMGKDGSYIVYACAHCTHYLARKLAVGKRSICWKCGQVFEMNSDSITVAKPKCFMCRKGRDLMPKLPPELSLESEGEALDAITAAPSEKSVDDILSALLGGKKD